MDQVRILHCADLHLGSRRDGVQASFDERENEKRFGFRRLIDLCREERVQLLLIAGDLFDRLDIAPALLREVQERLGGLSHTRVFIAPGNHDYYAVDSPYAQSGWPENTVIFHGAAESVVVPEWQVCVTGVGFEASHVSRFLFEGVDVRHYEGIHIGLAHGELSGKKGGEYHPISVEALARWGFDYLALGHIHRRTPILRESGLSYAYPGCPVGTGFDELGEKGAYLGTIGKGGTALRFVPIARRCYYEKEVVLTGAENREALTERILSELRGVGEAWTEQVYRIVLIGEVSDEAALLLPMVQADVCAQLFSAEFIDRTTPQIDADALTEECSLRGAFARAAKERIRTAQERGESEEVRQWQNALRVGLRAFSGKEELLDYSTVPSDLFWEV
ncbi:MAG: DNA repair exonuclease [Ndongobacter sp.]|nr:DNA repair exonuclease [Ndongobacter sp.]